MRRALIIANEVYHDRRFATLPGVVADANSLEQVLEDPAIGGFEVTVLRDAGVVDIGIAVANHFNGGHPDDVLLLHISAHGLKDAHGNLFFAASNSSYDTHLLNPTALSAADIREEMADSRARRIIVLLDCCYSGAFVRDERSRGVDAEELTRPFRGRGHVVITASTSVQPSYESGGQGVFTRAVVEALRTGWADRDGDGVIDTDELYRYVAEAVRRAEPRQTPTLSQYNVEGILQVARNPRHVPDGPPSPIQGDRRRPSVLGRVRHAAALGRTGIRRRYGHRRQVGPLTLPHLGAISILVVWSALLALGAQADATATSSPACVHPPVVRVATSTSGYLTGREIADAYERWTAGRNNGCPTVRLYLYPASAEAVWEGIQMGWPSSGEPGRRYLREVGPHPDLFMPESRSDLAGMPAGAEQVIATDQIASSPLVLGVPAGRVRQNEDAHQRAMVLSWRDLFVKATRPVGPPARGAQAGGAGWGVVRADPTTSRVARLATIALYRSGRDDLIASSRAREEIEQPLDRSLDNGAYPIGDDAALLCRQRTLGTPPAATTPAVILTEQALIRFNHGRPLGGGCGTHARPDEQHALQAFYPSDSPVIVSVVVRLRWADPMQGGAVRKAAAAFVDWLRSKAEGRRALLRAGLRPMNAEVGEPVDESSGVLPNWPFRQPREVDELSVDQQDDALALYAEAHRPGRVLVALDASGSMGADVAPGRTRFKVALDGVGRSLARMGSGDQFGLYTFSSVPTNSKELVSVGSFSPEHAEKLRTAVKDIEPAGNTPLYQAIRDGSRAVRGGEDNAVRALVVLTDGQDTSGASVPSPTELRGVRVYFLAVGDVSCAGSVLDRLAARAGGRCFDTSPTNINDVLSQVFEGLWKGTG